MKSANLVNFDSLRLYRWLLSISAPNPKLYAYLRANCVDLKHIFNLLDGAVALCPCSFHGFGRPPEPCIALPVLQADAETPIDVLVFSMVQPAKFRTMLRLGGLLGANEVDNPASYWNGTPCPLWTTPLRWLQEGCRGAVVLDAALARPLLVVAPGSLAAEALRR